MLRLPMMALMLLLSGCSGDAAKEYVFVAPAVVSAVPPSECTLGNPAFPKLPETEPGVDGETAARDRLAIETRYREIARRRSVCRAWLEQTNTGAATVAAKS